MVSVPKSVDMVLMPSCANAAKLPSFTPDGESAAAIILVAILAIEPEIKPPKSPTLTWLLTPGSWTLAGLVSVVAPVEEKDKLPKDFGVYVATQTFPAVSVLVGLAQVPAPVSPVTLTSLLGSKPVLAVVKVNVTCVGAPTEVIASPNSF